MNRVDKRNQSKLTAKFEAWINGKIVNKNVKNWKGKQTWREK